MRTLTSSDLRTPKTGLTVAELIDELSTHDPEAIVVFACDYGDICHTQQAMPVSSADELDPDGPAATWAIVGATARSGGAAMAEVQERPDDLRNCESTPLCVAPRNGTTVACTDSTRPGLLRWD